MNLGKVEDKGETNKSDIYSVKAMKNALLSIQYSLILRFHHMVELTEGNLDTSHCCTVHSNQIFGQESPDLTHQCGFARWSSLGMHFIILHFLSSPSQTIWQTLQDIPYPYSSITIFWSTLVTISGGGCQLVVVTTLTLSPSIPSSMLSLSPFICEVCHCPLSSVRFVTVPFHL